MASPIGHSLAGIFGFLLIARYSNFCQYYSSKLLIVMAIIFANFPDIDIILGYLFFHNLSALHRQFTHSFSVAFIVGLIFFCPLTINKKIPYTFLIWLWVIYSSHILLDMSAYDINPPIGVQCFFPFSLSYFAFPISILGRVVYNKNFINWHNFLAIIQEFFVISLLFFVILLTIESLKYYEKIKN